MGGGLAPDFKTSSIWPLSVNTEGHFQLPRLCRVGVESHWLRTVSLQESQRGSTQEGPKSPEEAENPP